jgi:hypothetical protein
LERYRPCIKILDELDQSRWYVWLPAIDRVDEGGEFVNPVNVSLS